MRLFFSVGEPSGDQHAAKLIQALRARVPQLEATGFGGEEMRRAGCRIDFRLTDLAVMGFFRVLPMLGKFYSLVRRAGRILQEERPDAVVLVDFPGFNWWIARKAKALGIPVFYYLPPQLWAWAPWRIKRVRKYVDHVICGLAFEQKWYASRGVSATYVGHPFFDEVAEHRLEEAFIGEQRARGGTLVGLLPGSRNHEVEQNWPVMIKAICKLTRRHPQARYLVACFKERHRDRCQELLTQHAHADDQRRVKFVVGKTSEVIEAADCCLMVSGSVSLEMLARQTPAVVIYYFSRVSGWLARLLIRCRYVSLPNLMVDREILPEFFPQGDGEEAAQDVANQLSEWIRNPQALGEVRSDLAQLHAQVGGTGAIDRAAEAILEPLTQQLSRRAA